MGDPVTVSRRVLLAAPRGWCAGVDRAVATVEQALDRFGAPIYVRKQIVHNKYVVKALAEKGAIFVDETQEVPEHAIVVFSAHGVAPLVHDEAQVGKLATIDATCPLVTKVHKEAKRFAKDDYDILLIGHQGHEEVIGTIGQAPDRIHLVDGARDVAAVEVRDESKVVWLSQTTLSVDETMATVGELTKRFPLLVSPPSDDICYATHNRQAAVRQLAAETDLLIVVGSKNSSNSVRLVEVGLENGAKAAHLVDFADEIDETWLEGAFTVGVTSGASVPEILVEGVLVHLAERGYADVQTVTTTAEHRQFSLPKELRRDLRTEATAGSTAPNHASTRPVQEAFPAPGKDHWSTAHGRRRQRS
ncbi:4-hydroxy-3-methylbut-2-enyl diphosphate reductase [Streptomyces sp. NPDC052013]|uniref:4-hydroxy-3-methylbut-2-enyl diphosphate reductase n=1 Tax=Streptomyces sp. NPDC052013 TaxID=3365679 RepID=UPI0037D22979